MMLLRQSISRIRPLWWVGAFALGDLAVGTGSLALAHGVASSVLHDVSGVAAAAAIGIGIAWHRPRPPAPWALVGAGILLLASGDIAYETDAAGATLALFSVGDWLYLAGYVALAVALAWFRVPTQALPLGGTDASRRRGADLRRFWTESSTPPMRSR
jgi:hypothetical protein